MSKNYTLQIDVGSPEAIPTDRLDGYKRSLAAMLGYEDAVHYRELETGILHLVASIDEEKSRNVATRLAKVACGKGDGLAAKAYSRIVKMLAEDRASGFIYEGDEENAKIIAFPLERKPRQKPIGPIDSDDPLDGILIRIGGYGRLARLQLQDGRTRHAGIETERDNARQIAKHLYKPVRLFGIGQWLRDQDGKWVLQKFRMDSFCELEDDDPEEIIDRLRAHEGNQWKKMDDPVSVVMSLRDNSEELR